MLINKGAKVIKNELIDVLLIKHIAIFSLLKVD